MEGYTYVTWFLAIWLTLQLGQCSQMRDNREIITALNEIKMEMKTK